MEIIDSKHKKWIIQTIQSIFPNAEILAFGSRIHGTSQKYSDLDIALKQDVLFPRSAWRQLEEHFEESDLPFKVDPLEFSSLSQDFQN